jgi:hypothetical protein
MYLLTPHNGKVLGTQMMKNHYKGSVIHSPQKRGKKGKNSPVKGNNIEQEKSRISELEAF